MNRTTDRNFDWIAALAYVSGAAVMVASLAALAITVVAVVTVSF